MASSSGTNKTVQTSELPKQFIEKLQHAVRKADAQYLLSWFEKTTGYPPVMWGASIVGFGRYHYQYKSGRQGDFLITGFSPRQSNLSIYIMPGYQDLSEPLSRLGKHKTGASCLYINKLADIDLQVLEEIVKHGLKHMTENYETWDR